MKPTTRKLARGGAEMKVYTNGTDWVIGESLDDARAAWAEHIGENLDGYLADEWRVLADDEPLTIWCFDDTGTPCEPDSDGASEYTKTASAWVLLEGRGFLCSTEY